MDRDEQIGLLFIFLVTFCLSTLSWSAVNIFYTRRKCLLKEIKTTIIGRADVSFLSEQEQKTFYATILARILELYRQQKEKEV